MTETSQTAMEAPAASKSTMEIGDIVKILPHRYPFLLIDRVIDLERMKRIVALKNVTINEPFFQGHFPQNPVMPGVLIIEAMAQTAGGLVLAHLGEINSGKLVYFMAIDGAKFRAPVEPGVLLRLEVEFTQKRMPVCKFAGKVMMEGKLAAEASFTAMIADPPKA